MNMGYVAASYVPPGGTKQEKAHRQEQWERYQQQVCRSSAMDKQHEDPHTTSTPAPVSRKRADSHSQPYSQSHLEPEQQRRFSSASHYSTQQPGQSSPPPEVRRISGNFNAPTHVEIERHNDTAKSTRSKIKRLENTVKGWVRA